MQLIKYFFATKFINLEQILKLFSNQWLHNGIILQLITKLLMVILFVDYNLCKTKMIMIFINNFVGIVISSHHSPSSCPINLSNAS
jgi:hypothetical protein